MIIKRLVHIKNYGKFKNCVKSPDTDWDFSFKKVNVIYAPNGYGKTSFSVLLGAIKGDTDIVLKKTTFGSMAMPSIKFIMEDNKELKIENGALNRSISEVEVFDSFYLEDNLYTIAVDDGLSSVNIFELPILDQIIDLKNRQSTLKSELAKVRRKVTNRKRNFKATDQVKSYKKDEKYLELSAEKKLVEAEYEQVRRELADKTEHQLQLYMEKINKYLSLFTDSMQLTDVKLFRKGEKSGMVYGLSIAGHEISIQERTNVSIKYYLSDGDKNALGLAFFLARIDMIPNKEKYIVVVDDPFTSFDSQRKMTTITQLSRIANRVGQFFLLTHDMYFANDFNNACNSNSILNLRITSFKDSSMFVNYDIKTEMLTGFNKDLMTLRLFLKGEIIDDPLHLRDVVRCIRPSIEGIFRIKYYNYVNETQWLGDFIKMIRDADATSVFGRLQPLLEELEELNDYSKVYHHSNPNYLELSISRQELKNYVKRTLSLIELI